MEGRLLCRVRHNPSGTYLSRQKSTRSPNLTQAQTGDSWKLLIIRAYEDCSVLVIPK